MTVQFKCPHCSKSLNVPDTLAGKTGKCPACLNRVQIPSSESQAPVNPARSQALKGNAVALPAQPALPVTPVPATVAPIKQAELKKASSFTRFRLVAIAATCLLLFAAALVFFRGELKNAAGEQVASKPLVAPSTKYYDSKPEVAAAKPGDVITNGIGMKLTLIPAGEFTMGSAASDSVASDDERPQHKVKITKPFYLGIHEVTQSQWQAVMNTTPWSRRDDMMEKEGADFPAMYVIWDDATEFCKKLSTKEGKTYRLPTEAEWEYACRAGTTTKYGFGDDDSRLSDYAWWGSLYDGNTKYQPYAHAVGQKKPNAWGLYDMHGNLYEWCSDWYGDKYYYYGASLASDPTGPATGLLRVVRGGCSYESSAHCRSAFRHMFSPDYRSTSMGFRVALVP